MCVGVGAVGAALHRLLTSPPVVDAVITVITAEKTEGGREGESKKHNNNFRQEVDREKSEI